MTTAPRFEPVDDETGDLLDLIAEDWSPFAQADRDRVARAIRAEAEAHHGQVSPNRVRHRLAGLPVHQHPRPQIVGPTYRRLVGQGYLAVDGWEVSDDTTGRNSGKPHRTYRWLPPT